MLRLPEKKPIQEKSLLINLKSMLKLLRKLTLLVLLILSLSVSGQPPPPPPDPGGIGTDPYPPGWVGKSPVGDGAILLVAFALAYALKRYLDSRKEKPEEEVTLTE